MSFTDELKKTLKAAVKQLTTSNPTQAIRFTPNFYEKAKAAGLTEKDALDVYYHGTETKPLMVVKDYSGYSIGLYYFKDHKTGKPVISTIWKRERR